MLNNSPSKWATNRRPLLFIMIKKTLLLLPFVLFFSVLAAQDTLNIKSEVSPWTLYALGGVDRNTLEVDVAYADDYHYESRNGVVAGLAAQYDLKLSISQRNFFIPDCSVRGSLLWVQKDYKFYRNNANIRYVYTAHTNNYLNIPVEAMLSWGKVFHVDVFGGFYLGAWLNGRLEGRTLSLDMLTYGNEESTFFDTPYEFNKVRDNRFDAGLSYGFGCGASLGKVDLVVNLRWLYALSDVQKHYMLFQNPRYNTTFALTAGFGLAF